MRGGQAVTEPTPTSAHNYEMVKEQLDTLLSWTCPGVVLDAMSDVLAQHARTEGKAWFALGQALYAARIASGLPGYYLPPP